MKLKEIRIFILKFRDGKIDLKVKEPWNTKKYFHPDNKNF